MPEHLLNIKEVAEYLGVSEDEVKRVVKYFADRYRDMLPSEIELSNASVSVGKSIFEATIDDEGDDDELYEQAREEVISAGKASTSYLQRKLKVGYARAARLVDMLEERGVIGPGEGAKPREVMVKMDEETDNMPNYPENTTI